IDHTLHFVNRQGTTHLMCNEDVVLAIGAFVGRYQHDVFRSEITNYTEGDLAPEDIVLVPTNESPDGKYYVLVAHEVSSTLAVYEVEGVINSIDEGNSDLVLRMYPNPSAYEVSVEVRGQEVLELQAHIFTLDGREVLQAERQAGFGALTVNVADLTAGIYLVQVHTELGQAQQRLIVR
ncbi:MAG: T9SS type A sorting domain-containing protein, partial [Bacteroidota bacterium]